MCKSRFVAVILVLASTPAAVGAQDRDWRWRAVGEFGLFHPTRDLGKAVGNLPELSALQATATIDPAPFVGGGIEAMSVARQLVFRLAVRTTLGAEATGQLGVCNIATGDVCAPRRAEAKVTLFSGEVAFVQGNPAQTFRPVLMGGIGARRYSFSAEPCPPGASQVATVCEMITGIFEDPGMAPFFQFGFGVEARLGPLVGQIRLQDVVGSYNGGTGNVTGDLQNDVMGFMGAAITIR